MELDKLKEAFINGCIKIGGDIKNQRDGIVCIDEALGVKVKLNKDGKWIKAYEMEDGAYVLKVWGEPEDIKFEHGVNYDYLVIRVKGMKEEIAIPGGRSFGVAPLELIPYYIDPKFQEQLRKKREQFLRTILSKKLKE